jgi:hypothetical protein
MTVETIGGAKIDIDVRVLEEVFGVDDGAVNTLGVAFRPVSILVGKAVLDARPAGHGASRWEKPRAVLLIAAYCVAVRVGTGDLAAIYSSLGGGPVDDSRARIYSVTDACRLAAGMVDACSPGRPAVPTITAMIATTIRRRRI